MPVRLNTLSSRWDIAIPEQTKVEEYYSSDHGFHGDGFAAEVIQTDTIPDDRYKRRNVRYYLEYGLIESSTFSSEFGSETVYDGFYYSGEDVPCGFQGTSMSFQFDGGGWSWHESDGDNFEYTEKILGKAYWYRMHF